MIEKYVTSKFLNNHLIGNIIPKDKKDALRNWVFFSEEQLQFYNDDINEYTFKTKGVNYNIEEKEIKEAIDYYFSY